MSLLKITAALLLLGFSSLFAAEGPMRIYPKRFDPADHPDHGRYAVTPPDWNSFGGKTQFICCRGFPSVTDPQTGLRKGVDFDKTYRQFADAGLGIILWPHQSSIYIENLDEFARWAKENNLFVFDVSGYVPGSGPYGSGDWVQSRPGREKFDILESVLGPLWLGMDNGEQDGRYIGGYAPNMIPITRSRFDQYLNFQRHFERLGDDQGQILSTLVSLNFGHYFLKEGTYTLIGAETAQALPNSQVYYSWIRGAGKQYGVLWFGNASVWNRWGAKKYPDMVEEGTSLNLLKRLMYSHILYNSAGVGFEAFWFDGNGITPLGRIQSDAAKWLGENGDPGTMITPVALLSDFYCGWSFPQHLYTLKTYRVWGNVPYDKGDYLNNDLLGLIYPGYQDSSYYHDETGFLTPTPYGDGADSLLSDAPLWLLNRYPLLMAADRFTGGDPRRNTEGGPTERNPELIEKLKLYVENGGRLVLTAGNLEALDGLFGMRIAGRTRVESGAAVRFADGNEVIETRPFDLLSVTLPENARIAASCNGQSAAFEFSFGKGSVLVLNTPFGLSAEPAAEGPVRNRIDEPLLNPFPLLAYAEKLYRSELDKTVLFDVGEGLGSVVCRKGGGVWTVGVFNNTLSEKPFEIRSRIGEIASVRELPISTQERSAVGFLPKGFEASELGTHTEKTIAGADVRIFEVTLAEEKTELIEDLPIPPAPKGRYLDLRDPKSAKEEVMARPTFFEHYDGICLDWRYLDIRSEKAAAYEAGWLRRHGIHIAVDFSSGINLYPDLRLIHNDPEEYARSIAVMKEVIDKAALLGAETVLFSTHRVPENNYSAQQARADTVGTLRELAEYAAGKGMAALLRVDLNQPLEDIGEGADYLNEINHPDFKLAVRLPLLVSQIEKGKELRGQIGMIFSSGNLYDPVNDQIWTSDLPLEESENRDAARQVLEEFPEIPLIE